MKNIKSISVIFTIVLSVVGVLFQTSCRKNLLDQDPTTEIPANVFWKTEADAVAGLMGAYAATRPCFDRDYYMDGHGEYVRARGTSTTNGNLRLGDAYNGGNYDPSGYAANFDKMYRYLYGAVNRANYVIANVNKMQAEGTSASSVVLETILGEARLLRGMAYFKLIAMWPAGP